MINDESRLGEIQERFDHHFGIELGIGVISMDLPRWVTLSLGPYTNYGWAFPVATHPDERSGDLHGEALSEWADRYIASCREQSTPPLILLFVYSPDVIVESTAHLSNAELDAYLNGIESMVDKYVGLRIDEPDPEARLRRIEEWFYEAAGHQAMQFMSAVQMAALPPTVRP